MGKSTASIEIRPTEAVTPAEWDEVWQLTRRLYDTTRAHTEPRLRAHQQLARPTPTWEAALMDHYALLKYGDAWQANGVVQRSPQKRLLPQTAPLETRLLADANLQFYARANPGHAGGDMLLCLCPLNLGNWRGIGVRAIARLERRQRRAT